jgi:hypothetical protein
VKPSYNIQSILNLFSGGPDGQTKHYIFGKEVSPEVFRPCDPRPKDKISKGLLGRVRSPEAIQNHILGARKKPVYCYDSNTGKIFNGI